MNRSEFSIYVGGHTVKVLMQAGFFYFGNRAVPLHNHLHAELHFIEQGACDFYIDNMHIHAQAGDLLAIPKGVFHYYTEATPDLQHCAFQITLPIKSYKKILVPVRLLSNMMQLIDEYRRTGRRNRLSAHLILLCSYFIPDPAGDIPPIEDRKLLIYEFFSKRYHEDVSLNDLAQILNLSSKQTERMVEKYTGNSFRSEITRHRMEAAAYLMKMQNLPLTDIAVQVGYKSYSGFWKAYKMYTESTQETPLD